MACRNFGRANTQRMTASVKLRATHLNARNGTARLFRKAVLSQRKGAVTRQDVLANSACVRCSARVAIC